MAWVIAVFAGWVVLVVLAVVALVRYIRRPIRPVHPPAGPLDILTRRHAAGQIDARTYDETRSRIEDERPR